MEKNVAVREWCLERALAYHDFNSYANDTLIETAQMFEAYINTGKIPSRFYDTKHKKIVRVGKQ